MKGIISIRGSNAHHSILLETKWKWSAHYHLFSNIYL